MDTITYTHNKYNIIEEVIKEKYTHKITFGDERIQNNFCRRTV